MTFGGSQSAHAFHAISGEIIYMLESRLAEVVDSTHQQDRLTRLNELSMVLSDLAVQMTGGSDTAADSLLQAVRRLTGAREVFLVKEICDGHALTHDDDVLGERNWSQEAARLLAAAGTEGWRQTVISDSTDPRLDEACLLAVTAAGGSPAPGLVMIGKQRLYALDGTVFTDFDAQLALRLASLAPGLEKPVLAVLDDRDDGAAEQADSAPLPAANEDKPPLSETTAVSDAKVFEKSGAFGNPTILGKAALRQTAIDVLRREMDRCDRYHTVFALAVFRPNLPAELGGEAVQELVRRLRDKVRSSDYVLSLDEDTLLVLTPEDIQSIARLEQRVIETVRDLAGAVDLEVPSAHTVYPGRHDGPEGLLDDVLAALDAAL